MIGLASEATAALLGLAGPADETLSRYFRAHRSLGRRERAFVAEAAYAVLRRRRSLEAAARSSEPRALVLCALVRILGYSARSLDSAIAREELAFVAQLRSVSLDNLSPAVRADLPDWLWERLVAEQGEEEAARIAAGLLQPAPLDLRVNIARTTREEALQRLRDDGLQAVPTPHSPAGLRLPGKPAINRHPLFVDGLIEVQDEGSQLLAWLVAPRRGEMIADYCAGAGGKTLALAMLMRASGRVYAMDVSAKRLSALSPRAARARVTSIHPLVLSGENDTRAKRLAGKLDRVLVDAPCSGFGTLRRNPDLKWRHGPDAVRELAAKQQAILRAASRLVKRGGRLVYATCSILREENEAVVDAFVAAHPQFAPESCGDLLSAQKIAMEAGERLRLWPHVHGTDGFFAAAFRRET
ncbi:MAG: RsmB/NOP family class I SAM-dependent RNA methyltransferase [Betaproteobacteria bacterium]|nr:RsmB/NOP family class I SAM-dependent RNA methyltransferase [Betaproteobacteria bacterium]